jgi:ABC-type branched-subunit amino acid transport system substrate-binding protein
MRERARGGRILATGLAALLTLAACTGDRGAQTAADGAPATSPAAHETGVSGDQANPATAAEPASQAESPGSKPGDASTGSSRSVKGGRTEATGRASGRATPNGVVPDSLVPEFRAADERIGVSDKTLKLCTHANGQAAAAIGATQEDSRVFWRWLNDQGGIHGRSVEMVVSDDADGANVAGAYEECQGSFMLIGGPTQEAVPSMREIVERDPHPMPYLHFMARSDAAKRYSFSWYPTQETYGRRVAEYVLNRYKGLRIGVIRRDTPNWEPGYRAFVERLREAGVRPVDVVAHQPREQLYEPYLASLDERGAQVVWAWNHALDHIPMLRQARARGYGFKWVLGFPVSAVTETLGRDAVVPDPLTGVAVFLPFRPQLHDPRYAEEAKLFEAAYSRYRGRQVDPVLGDLLFHAWLDYRQVAELLTRCGRDCTRTKLVETLVGAMSHRAPLCPFDFRLGRMAGDAVSVVEAYSFNPGQAAWRLKNHCLTSFSG